VSGEWQFNKVNKMVTDVTNYCAGLQVSKRYVSRYVVDKGVVFGMGPSRFKNCLQESITIDRLEVKFSEMVRGSIVKIYVRVAKNEGRQIKRG
jgi:hypothetical protein